MRVVTVWGSLPGMVWTQVEVDTTSTSLVMVLATALVVTVKGAAVLVMVWTQSETLVAVEQPTGARVEVSMSETAQTVVETATTSVTTTGPLWPAQLVTSGLHDVTVWTVVA